MGHAPAHGLRHAFCVLNLRASSIGSDGPGCCIVTFTSDSIRFLCRRCIKTLGPWDFGLGTWPCRRLSALRPGRLTAALAGRERQLARCSCLHDHPHPTRHHDPRTPSADLHRTHNHRPRDTKESHAAAAGHRGRGHHLEGQSVTRRHARPNPNQSSSPPQQPPPPRIYPPPDAPLPCLCPSKSKYRWPSRATGRTTSWSRSASTPPRRRRPSGRSRLVWWVCSVGGCCDWSTTTSRCGSIINRLIGAGPVGRSIDWTDEEGSGGCPGSVGRSI